MKSEDIKELFFNKQAQLITELRKENNKLKFENIRLKKYEHPGIFYNGMFEAIKDDENLQEEWSRFMTILRMTKPNIPGITIAGKVKGIDEDWNE